MGIGPYIWPVCSENKLNQKHIHNRSTGDGQEHTDGDEFQTAAMITALMTIGYQKAKPDVLI